AAYVREFAKRGVSAFGVDLSPEMAKYARKRTEENGVECSIIEGDFRGFELGQKVDLAILMMATFGYLLSNRDVLTHFNTVADNLSDNGLYLIELAHPREVFNDRCTKNQWEIEKGDQKIEIDWASDAVFDPLTEIDKGTVRFKWMRGGEPLEFSAVEETRRYSLGLIRSLVEQSGRFKIATMYGDLDLNRTLDNDKESWRMILVLRKY
ncbi:MAG TPA: class I SAM-dependent methyltransferase, partial [Planctomycetaceae bacterium]|nr:class I SAM-dependent methyltransferase [Planctomycetaceae bacterium]